MKQEMIDGIKEFFIKEAHECMRVCGFGSIIVYPGQGATNDQIKDAQIWLGTFVMKQVKPFMSIYRLRTPDTWDMYETYKDFDDTIKNLEEVKLLKKYKSTLIEAWTQRPGVLRRMYPYE
jgi:hypothetical protein